MQSFYLCLACLGQNLYVLLVNPIFVHRGAEDHLSDNYPYCIFGAILKVWLDLSSIIWTSLIIFSVFASVVLKINSLQSLKI
jgi:hypothetical protein